MCQFWSLCLYSQPPAPLPEARKLGSRAQSTDTGAWCAARQRLSDQCTGSEVIGDCVHWDLNLGLLQEQQMFFRDSQPFFFLFFAFDFF